MEKIFRFEDSVDRGAILPAKWSNIERQIDIQMKSYYKFHRSSDATLNSSNLLVRLIQQNTSFINEDLFTFINEVSKNVNKMNSLHGLTSFNHIGEIKDNVFMDTEASVVSVTGPIPDVSNWQEISPIRIVEHVESEIGLIDLNNQKLSDGVVYLELNIVDLLVMYRSWAFHRLQNNQDKSPHNFVARYVIPNAMRSYLNISLINSFFKVESDSDLDMSDLDLSSELKRTITKEYRQHFDLITKMREPLPFYLKSIPTYNSIAINDLKLLSFSSSINISTFLIITRHRLYNYLTDISVNNKSVGINNEYHNDMWFLVKRVMSEKGLQNSRIIGDIDRMVLLDYFKREKGGVR